jgi:hypothetical protein
MGTMKPSDLLADAFDRIGEKVAGVLGGLTAEALNWRPAGTGNSIAWLAWHIARVQDEQVADVAGLESVWTQGGYAERFGFAIGPNDTGYGHSPEQVGAVRVEAPELLLEYHQAVQEMCLRFVRGVGEAELDRIVDRRWDPPVTMGVRLVSVLDDCMQHAGQAAYVKGLHRAS